MASNRSVGLILDQDARVTAWVAERSGSGPAPPTYFAIGYEDQGELVCGAYFDGCTETNIFAHVASARHTFPQEFLVAIAVTLFDVFDYSRVTLMIRDNNQPAISAAVTIGASLEAVLKQGHAKGDTLLFVLWRDNLFARKLLQRKRRFQGVEHGAISA